MHVKDNSKPRQTQLAKTWQTICMFMVINGIDP